jgi:hypothetical protein
MNCVKNVLETKRQNLILISELWLYVDPCKEIPYSIVNLKRHAQPVATISL